MPTGKKAGVLPEQPVREGLIAENFRLRQLLAESSEAFELPYQGFYQACTNAVHLVACAYAMASMTLDRIDFVIQESGCIESTAILDVTIKAVFDHNEKGCLILTWPLRAFVIDAQNWERNENLFLADEGQHVIIAKRKYPFKFGYVEGYMSPVAATFPHHPLLKQDKGFSWWGSISQGRLLTPSGKVIKPKKAA